MRIGIDLGGTKIEGIILSPDGIIEKKIEFGQSGYIDLQDKIVFQETVFSEYGHKMFLIIILLYIFLIFSFNRIS